MKQLFAFFITLITISLPALGQWQQHPQLSPDDQRRFDSYFSRWQEYRRTNNRSEVLSMEKRMQDIYAHSRISADTPYWRAATAIVFVPSSRPTTSAASTVIFHAGRNTAVPTIATR